MGNPLKGDVTFEAGGRSRRLRYSADALCAMEGQLDMGIFSIAQKLQDPDPRLEFIRVVFWAGLLEQDPEITVREAGDLVVELGVMDALAKIAEAMQAAFPEKKGASAGPRKARAGSRAGTSKASSGPGAN